jgi:putative oxidoreductase
MDVGLLLVRAVLGAIMAAHGAQKLLGWFGGHGLAGTGGWLESMGFKPARLHARVVALAELGGGLLLALGLLTPLGAAAVSGVMLVAIATVHWSNGFFNTSGGYEFNLLIAATAIALAITGPGALSIDYLAGRVLAGPAWGIAALVTSAAAAAAVLAMRRAHLARAQAQGPHEELPARP